MAVRTYFDGTEITNVVQQGSSQHWLNRKYQATASILVEDYDPSFFTDGGRLLITGVTGNDADNDFHGIAKVESAEDGEDADGTVELTAESPRELWEWRMARNGPASGDAGNYSKPTFFELGQAPVIMEDILTQSMDDSDPADGEGTLFIVIGSVPTGGTDLAGAAPTDNPMQIEEIAQLLCSTGELDIVEVFSTNPALMATVNFYDGNYGTDLSATVNFDYATGAHNVKQIRRVRDRTKECNKLRYLLGPKLDDEHWKRSIEATNADVMAVDPPYTDIITLRTASRAAVGVRQDVRIYDAFANESSVIPLYIYLWLDEQKWRAQPRTLVNVTPVDGLLPTFDVGDAVGINYGARFLGGGTGKQRIYGRKVTWDAEGVVTLGELTASEDGDAA